MPDLHHQPEFATLIVERSNGITDVTLNRPERKNALSEEMYGELTDLCHWLCRDASTRVLVVRGAGGAFCSGADVGGPRDESIAGITRMRQHGDLAIAWHRLPMPTIAVVDGAAVGAGCNFALGCDFVIATPNAFFAEVFVHRGLGFDWGGSWLLPRLVGLRRAKELAFLGDRMSGTEAAEIGLINRVVEPDELAAEVEALAQRLAVLPPLALTMMKEELHASMEPSFVRTVGVETYGQIAASGTRDSAEGFRAFIEKRPPIFEGR